MDPRKRWRCPKCGATLTDEQRIREGCRRCAEIAWEKEMGRKYGEGRGRKA